tara:strand:+ start:123 stop:947 length:825 start_codon:yes stop_codon:yes gene_type:complete
MTIRQQGGIFGRNPSFNDVEANEINIGDGASGGSINISKDESGGFTAIVLRNESTASNTLKHSGITFRGTDTIGTNKPSAFIRSYPEDGNYVNSSLSFSTRSGDVTAEKARLTSAGNLKFINAGNGIDFSATSGAGTSELFDDYEEGTWSPVISDATSGGNTGTATVAYATYTKIGNLVHLKARLLNMNTTGMGSGNIYVQGVPYSADGDGEGIATMSYFTAAANSLGIVPSIDNGASHIKLKEVISGSVYINADSSQFNSGTADLWITITYNT